MKVSEPPTLKLNAAWYKERRGFNSLITIRQTNNIDSIMMPWDHQHTHTCMLRKNRQLLNFIMISVRIITQYRCSRIIVLVHECKMISEHEMKIAEGRFLF